MSKESNRVNNAKVTSESVKGAEILKPTSQGSGKESKNSNSKADKK